MMTSDIQPPTSDRQSLVMIGNGMAGAKMLEELLAIAPDQYDITVFGAEPTGNYNRIMLSPLLAGDKAFDEIMLNDVDWYLENDITLYAGDAVLEINRARKRVISERGRSVPYDKLVIATGSSPFVLPVPGNDLPGVLTFRDVSDVAAMLTAANHYRHAVVIGGGLLGLEAANGLLKRGMQVTVVHLAAHLMERQLDEVSGHLLKQSLEQRGVEFELQASTAELVGDHRVRAVRFADGREIPADCVVMAAGIRLNIELAEKAGVHCERGIVVTDTMQTYDPSIYAVGECVQHRGQCYGLVAPLFEQARICANQLALLGRESYGGTVTSTTLKVSGIDLFSSGDFNGDDESQALVYRDLRSGVYKRLMVSGNRLTGAVLYGDTKDGRWYHELIELGADISAVRDRLIFGRAYAEDALPTLAEAA